MLAQERVQIITSSSSLIKRTTVLVGEELSSCSYSNTNPSWDACFALVECVLRTPKVINNIETRRPLDRFNSFETTSIGLESDFPPLWSLRSAKP